MKIVITGHTRGIGKELADVFQNNGHTVIGYSKSTGHNINDIKTQQIILDQLKESDMFINNAYAPISQTVLLKNAIDLWKGTDNKIINLSSKGTILPPNISRNIKLTQYISDKQQQNKLISSHLLDSTPQILNVIAGPVDTQLLQNWKYNKINPTDLANLIYQVAITPLLVQEIIVDAPGIDWNNCNW